MNRQTSLRLVLAAALIVLAMMRHPTGGTDFAVYPFLAGLIAMAIGTVWWVAIVISWLI